MGTLTPMLGSRLTSTSAGRSADVASIAGYAKVFKTFTVAPAPLSATESVQLGAVDHQVLNVDDRLRAELGLPPVN